MRLKFLIQAAGLALMLAGAAQAQIADRVVKIGVLTDMSGAYSDLGGAGAVVATQMAIDDFVAQENPAFKVEMVYADHQNKADIAANKAREWYERDGVDVVTELNNSTVALAVQKIGKEKNKLVLV
jgi:branched-chain amino acid transport system substrate-binding protein